MRITIDKDELFKLIRTLLWTDGRAERLAAVSQFLTEHRTMLSREDVERVTRKPPSAV